MAHRLQVPTLVDLAALDATALKALWRKLFKSAPPKIARKEFFVRMLAYAVQCKTYGHLTKESLRKLRGFDEGKSVAEASARVPKFGAGTRLVREWRGTTHEVMVMERGFAYRGRSYASLSEVARTITGARWSGPRFFGLRSPRREEVTKTA
jgi:hypothetical protein